MKKVIESYKDVSKELSKILTDEVNKAIMKKKIEERKEKIKVLLKDG